MQTDNSFYIIKSKHSNRSLDVCQDQKTKGMLIIYDYYGGSNQLFSLIPSGVEVQLVSKQSGKCLTIAANSHQNGTPVF